MTRDSAYATFLYDPRKGRRSAGANRLCRMYGVDPEHLPRDHRVHGCGGRVSRKKRRRSWDLLPGTGGLRRRRRCHARSASARAARGPAQTHIYSGTSGWVRHGERTDRRSTSSAMIAGIVGAQSGRYNYFAEMETAGKCFQWVKEHLALDEIGVYIDRTDRCRGKPEKVSLREPV